MAVSKAGSGYYKVILDFKIVLGWGVAGEMAQR